MTKVNLRQFDYEKVARFDTAMWRAYYDHQFLLLFWQLLRLMKSQLGLNWLITIRLTFYAGWAAADYRINRKAVKRHRVLKNLSKFYKLVSSHVQDQFDYITAAELELAWWDIHRHSYTINPQLEQALASAAAVMYGLKPSELANYAKFRAEAMILPRYTGNKDSSIDWQAIGELVQAAWQALHQVVQK